MGSGAGGCQAPSVYKLPSPRGRIPQPWPPPCSFLSLRICMLLGPRVSEITPCLSFRD